ncbi:MAG: hypothetical protein ACREON_10845, partial [Gemmatimonadaceae bacterium]
DFSALTLGFRAVSLADPDGLAEAQIGYSISAGGDDLTGTAPGDWRPSWLVIGHEDETGDPLFVDTTSGDWPVYTAAHGDGTWLPERIADGILSFCRALHLLRYVAPGRETPVALETNPVPESEQRRILSRIEDENPYSSLDFWESWLLP